jgi:hypothetical protein
MRIVIAAVVLSLWTAAAASGEVRLTIDNGRVTLVASNASTSEILAEWARIGQTKIVNGERVAGSIVSIELTDVPETEALEILLRSVSGYLLAPRRTPDRHLSRYDRIMIVPTSAPVRATPVLPPPVTPPGPSRPIHPPGREDDQAPASGVDAPPTAAPNRPSAFPPFPQGQPPTTAAPPVQQQPPAAAPPAPTGPTRMPTIPAGSSTPGVITAPPPAPGQPSQPGTAPSPPQQRQ